MPGQSRLTAMPPGWPIGRAGPGQPRPDALRLARATFRTIRRNLAWAFGYNVAAIPLAALGFLNPVIASAAMTLSSVFVVANSLRLQRYPLRAAGKTAGKNRPGGRNARLHP
jgi:P-type Cu+ transporter